MSDYTKSTDFASKDNLSSGNPLKIVKGTEIDTEFNNIATAIATKLDSNSGLGITLVTTLIPTNGSLSTSVTSLSSYKSIIVIVDTDMELSTNGGLRIALSSNNGSSYGVDTTFSNTGTTTPSGYVQFFRTDNSSSNKTGFRINPTATTNFSETTVTGVINAIRIGITTAATFTGSGTIYIYGCN